MCSHDYYNTQFNFFSLLQKKLNWTDNELCEHAFKLGLVFADLCKANNDKAPSYEEFTDELFKLEIVKYIEVN